MAHPVGFPAAVVRFGPNEAISLQDSFLSKAVNQMLDFTFLLLLAILAGFLISAPLVWWLIRLGRRASMLDSAGSGGHQKQLRSIPNIGGVGIFLGAILPLAAGVVFLWLTVGPASPEVPSTMDETNARILDQMGTWIAIIASCFVLHVIGVIDDTLIFVRLLFLVCVLVLMSCAAVVGLSVVPALHVGAPSGVAIVASGSAWVSCCALLLLCYFV